MAYTRIVLDKGDVVSLSKGGTITIDGTLPEVHIVLDESLQLLIKLLQIGVQNAQNSKAKREAP